MTLRGDITSLRDSVLRDLNAAYDYYTDTKIAWKIVRKLIGTGHQVSVQNMATGTVTTQLELAVKSRTYEAEQLSEATFQQFISIFENFFFDILRLWLMAYPQSLGAKKLDFQAVLDSPDKDAIALLVVNKEVNDIAHERTAGWFKYLNDKANLGCPTPAEIERLSEAKASRDLLVHNRGVASKIYVSKAGRLARYMEGQRIDIPEQYHRETWELIRKVVADISIAAIAKAP